jgi:hypothetical protein
MDGDSSVGLVWYAVWRSDSETALHTPARALGFGVWDFIFSRVPSSRWQPWFGLGRWIFDPRLCICFRRGIGYATGCAMVLWVFGYGSLIWNPGFDFDDKILGFIKGYKRTFNLGMDACFAGACLGLGTPSLTRTSASTFSLVLFPTPQLALTTEAHRSIRRGPARLKPTTRPYA